MWALSTCGEPDEIKKNTHPEYITAPFRAQAFFRRGEMAAYVQLHQEHNGENEEPFNEDEIKFMQVSQTPPPPPLTIDHWRVGVVGEGWESWVLFNEDKIKFMQVLVGPRPCNTRCQAPTLSSSASPTVRYTPMGAHARCHE